MASIPAYRIPYGVGPGPFGSRGYSNWFKIFEDASAVVKDCVENGKAGMSWSRKFSIDFLSMIPCGCKVLIKVNSGIQTGSGDIHLCY